MTHICVTRPQRVNLRISQVIDLMVKQTIHLSIRASIRSSKHRLNAGAEISSFRRNVPNWLHRKLSKWHHFRCYQWQNCYQNHISISANRAKIATIINEPSKEPPSQSIDQYRKISYIVHTKHQILIFSRIGLQLFLHNTLKPIVKWRMKM